MNTGRARRGESRPRSRVQQRILADQRPIEVARDRLDVAREIRREVQPCGLLRKSTRSVSWLSGSDLYDLGMMFG